MLSNSRVTRIGELLKDGKEDAAALRELELFRSDFEPSYKHVTTVLNDLGLNVTGRFKTTISIAEKLRRSSGRLPQIQDIVGCRVMVASLSRQDDLVKALCEQFPNTRVQDRRLRPLHGYRAVHVIVTHESHMVEIQIRTRLQHFWANRSEKMADRFGQGIKYGIGSEAILQNLLTLSESVAAMDALSQRAGQLDLLIKQSRHVASKQQWKQLKRSQRELNDDLANLLRRTRALLEDHSWHGE